MATNYKIKLDETKPPATWKLEQPHVHAGKVTHNEFGASPWPPEGGWPSCCPGLVQSVKQALANAGYP